MLNDHDVEAALRRYQVADPPTELAHRIAAAGDDTPRTLEWIWGPAAAAAVLAVWIAFHLGSIEPPIDEARAQEVAFVTNILGGDANAAAYAESVVPESPTPDLQMALALLEESWMEN